MARRRRLELVRAEFARNRARGAAGLGPKPKTPATPVATREEVHGLSDSPKPDLEVRSIVSNVGRLRVLRAMIDEEGPIDGIHNEDVRELVVRGGLCPRYLGCTSEGTGESTYRDNPDFFAGDLPEMARWLASSFAEGWAANWVCDLDHPRAPGGEAQLDWTVFVQLPAVTTTPTVLDSTDLLRAANEVLVELTADPSAAEIIGAVTEVVNRSLGRTPAQRCATRNLISGATAGR